MSDQDQPDIAAMFPQVSLAPASEATALVPIPPVNIPAEEEHQARQQEAQIQAEIVAENQAALKRQLFAATLKMLDETMETSLACAMARVAFVAVASESEEPQSFLTQTVATWVQNQKAKFDEAPAELKIAIWEKLEAYASAQEQQLLRILVEQA